MKIIRQEDIIKAGCFNFSEAIKVCRRALVAYGKGQVIFPDKVSTIFDQELQNRINILPAGFIEQKYYGMKWVSVFPNNPKNSHLPNVNAALLLAEIESGQLIAFIDGTLCSNMRTASMSALAASLLAKKTPLNIGFIGAGEQAKSHFLAMKTLFPSIGVCKVASRTSASESKFVVQMRQFFPEVKFVECRSDYRSAVLDADIIVSAISGQERLLQSEWIKGGAFYSHVGGLEDDFSVPLMASKIVCDSWAMVKHRTQTISRMYHQGILRDDNIYGDLYEVVCGKKSGRENDDEFIYYNGVGLAYVDVAFAIWVYERCRAKNLGVDVAFASSPFYAARK